MSHRVSTNGTMSLKRALKKKKNVTPRSFSKTEALGGVQSQAGRESSASGSEPEGIAPVSEVGASKGGLLASYASHVTSTHAPSRACPPASEGRHVTSRMRPRFPETATVELVLPSRCPLLCLSERLGETQTS